MPMRKGFKRKYLFLISVSCVLIFTLSLPVYCDDDWEFITKEVEYDIYYDDSSVIIDKKKHIIKAWVKFKFSLVGKKSIGKEFLNNIIGEHKSKDVDYVVNLYEFDYRENELRYLNQIFYSTSGQVLYSNKKTTNWVDIIPNSLGETMLNKLCNDFKIKR